MRDDRLCKDFGQILIFFCTEFYALSNRGKTNSYKVLVFEILLFENQLPDGPPNGPCIWKGLKYHTISHFTIAETEVQDFNK